VSWTETEQSLARAARRQIFFVGGAPRSGTTWLQRMLDAHPDVSCGGEGHFGKELAEPLDALVGRRRQALQAKNEQIFRHTGGYALPTEAEAEAEADHLLGTGILLALERQRAGRPVRAIGEKTPENLFLFARLKRVFPGAKLICIARDPRDVLASAWHFFQKPVAAAEDDAAKIAFIKIATPPISAGARTMLALERRYPEDYRMVTYEGLCREPEPLLAGLSRFLGVTDRPEILRDCIAKTAFSAQTGGRSPGMERNGSFFRSGTVGSWRGTFSAEMNALILTELGWMFQDFGWQP
jgi:hypothetical protein